MSLGSVKRGCGSRVAGGIYAEVPTAADGKPIEYFLLDPPRPIIPDEIGLTPIGVLAVERDGVTHIMDWIGSDSYPNVADFVEEARRYGVSRRLPKTFDFSSLTEESRLIVVHARAWIEDHQKLLAEVPRSGFIGSICPKEPPVGYHPHESDGCIGLCWWDLEDGDMQAAVDESGIAIPVNREMPWGSYKGHVSPGKRKYQPAIFASFSIPRLAVVRDRSGNSTEDALEKAENAQLPVVLEDE